MDYGLVRADGSLLSNPACYRDLRTEPCRSRARKSSWGSSRCSNEYLCLAYQPFNTVFQLMADAASGHLGEATRALLLPDLINYFLTGEAATEFTNASTTQLLTTSGDWDLDLFSRLGLSSSIFAVCP